MENFSLEKINNLSPNDAKQYLKTFFEPLKDGKHRMLVNGKYEIIKKSKLKNIYFNRMSTELNTYYFKEMLPM